VDNVPCSFAHGITEPHYSRKRHNGLFLESVHELGRALANLSRGDYYGFYPEVRLPQLVANEKASLATGRFSSHNPPGWKSVCKASSGREFLCWSPACNRYRPRENFYRISDDKRTSQISASAESLLRRWEFVGIGFFIFFLTMFSSSDNYQDDETFMKQIIKHENWH
jgi:hypothetical protein